MINLPLRAQDLDVPTMFEEAKTRWLRPNEINAILCNHKHFTIHVKPQAFHHSCEARGTVVLFDRKMLRNFRRDGRNWKKKKDGKTVKEAHEHLKHEENVRCRMRKGCTVLWRAYLDAVCTISPSDYTQHYEWTLISATPVTFTRVLH
ncbi:calmodulin-binding transcription activator 5 [Tanacetum coccineum]